MARTLWLVSLMARLKRFQIRLAVWVPAPLIISHCFSQFSVTLWVGPVQRIGGSSRGLPPSRHPSRLGAHRNDISMSARAHCDLSWFGRDTAPCMGRYYGPAFRASHVFSTMSMVNPGFPLNHELVIINILRGACVRGLCVACIGHQQRETDMNINDILERNPRLTREEVLRRAELTPAMLGRIARYRADSFNSIFNQPVGE